ncbi:MAG: TolC family protein [Gemmatimonadales bacterium]
MKCIAVASIIATGMVAAGCGVPSVSGVPGAPPSPTQAWTPPADRVRADDSLASVQVPPDLEGRIRALTLTDVISIGLANNPATRVSWANARAAAATYGATRATWFPTIDGAINAVRTQSVRPGGAAGIFKQDQLSPALNLTWLLWDFSGRTGNVGAARETLIAADFTHNAMLQSTVLAIETAYFQYVATRALNSAQQKAVAEADTNLAVAEERHRVGVATIADVLQARTAASQAQLQGEIIEGDLQVTRGALATSLGFPANLPFDLDSTAAEIPVGALSDSVNALINVALQGRPDLQASRAVAAAAQAQYVRTRAGLLPSLQATGTLGQTYSTSIPGGASNYTIQLGLKIPLFDGGTRAYLTQAASASADAARESTNGLRQQVILDVFSAYYSLQSTTKQVHTADDLLASATESAEAALGRYRAGVGTLLDLLTAESALASARAQRVQSRLNWNLALAQLARNAGVLDPTGGTGLHLVSDTSSTVPAR